MWIGKVADAAERDPQGKPSQCQALQGIQVSKEAEGGEEADSLAAARVGEHGSEEEGGGGEGEEGQGAECLPRPHQPWQNQVSRWILKIVL